MSCDPNQLVAAAKCFQCLSSQQLQMVTNYLLCLISQNGDIGQTFTSQIYPISGNAWPSDFTTHPFLPVPHGLGAAPSFVRAVFVCTADDANWGLVAGQEIGIESIYEVDADVSSHIRPLQLWADAENIYACPLELTLVTGNEGLFLTETGLGITGGGLDIPSSLAHFAVKFYARL